MKHIVNFSGGKDSTAMLHLMLERGEPIDEIIYFDGGWEFPQMQEHVARVEQKTGLKITVLKPEKDFTYYLKDHVVKIGKNKGRVGYGWSSPTQRWCTHVKTDTIKKHVKQYRHEGYIQNIGFAIGEERRIKRQMKEGMEAGKFRFPLMEYNYDEVDCLKLCRKLGYDWGGLYDVFQRVSCAFCPLQGKKGVGLLKRHYPDLYNQMCALDTAADAVHNLKWKFRNGETVEQFASGWRGRDE